MRRGRLPPDDRARQRPARDARPLPHAAAAGRDGVRLDPERADARAARRRELGQPVARARVPRRRSSARCARTASSTSSCSASSTRASCARTSWRCGPAGTAPTPRSGSRSRSTTASRPRSRRATSRCARAARARARLRRGPAVTAAAGPAAALRPRARRSRRSCPRRRGRRWPAWYGAGGAGRVGTAALVIGRVFPRAAGAAAARRPGRAWARSALLVLILVQDLYMGPPAFALREHARLRPRPWHFGAAGDAVRGRPSAGRGARRSSLMLGFELGYFELVGDRRLEHRRPRRRRGLVPALAFSWR